MLIKNYKADLCKKFFSGKILLTDQQKLPDPSKIISKLPAFSIVILRYVPSKLLQHIYNLCKVKKIYLFLAYDYKDSKSIKLDGVHVKEQNLYHAIAKLGNRKPLLLSAACHNFRSAMQAQKLGYDFILYSPIFKTSSHINSTFLGLTKFRLQTKFLNIPIIALGGISKYNIKQLKTLTIKGFAAIDYFR
jgi:thiamine-phosphate pyrophosphorylase